MFIAGRVPRQQVHEFEDRDPDVALMLLVARNRTVAPPRETDVPGRFLGGFLLVLVLVLGYVL